MSRPSIAMHQALPNLFAILTRRTGLVLLAIVATCAALAAHAVAALIEARYLAPEAHARGAPHAPAPQPRESKVRPDGAELVARNMFCSTCVPATEPGSTDSFTPAATLIAVSVGFEPRATLIADSVLGSFGVGDEVPGVGTISQIGWTFVELVDASGHHGRVRFAGAPPPPAASQAAAPDPWEDRLKKIDDHTFEVDRSLVRELVSGVAKPGAVRITPIAGDNGQLAGLRFFGVRPGTLPAALGIQNADTITEINGAKITSANVLLDVLGKLDQLNVVEVDGTRAGKPLGITLRLR
jgi:hypothetical protein